MIFSLISEKGKYRWVLLSLGGFFHVWTEDTIRCVRDELEFSYFRIDFITHFWFETRIILTAVSFCWLCDVADLHIWEAICSYRPYSLLIIELEADIVEDRRKKCHLRNSHESDDDTDDDRRDCEDESALRTHRTFESPEYSVADSSPHHHDYELTYRKSCYDRIFIFYLKWDFILHFYVSRDQMSLFWVYPNLTSSASSLEPFLLTFIPFIV